MLCPNPAFVGCAGARFYHSRSVSKKSISLAKIWHLRPRKSREFKRATAVGADPTKGGCVEYAVFPIYVGGIATMMKTIRMMIATK